MIQVHAILFGDDGIAIEYYDGQQESPFPQTISLHIPFSVIERFPQVEMDMQEIIQDATTLIDSVNAARLSTTRQVAEMGRQ